MLPPTPVWFESATPCSRRASISVMSDVDERRQPRVANNSEKCAVRRQAADHASNGRRQAKTRRATDDARGKPPPGGPRQVSRPPSDWRRDSPNRVAALVAGKSIHRPLAAPPCSEASCGSSSPQRRCTSARQPVSSHGAAVARRDAMKSRRATSAGQLTSPANGESSSRKARNSIAHNAISVQGSSLRSARTDGDANAARQSATVRAS